MTGHNGGALHAFTDADAAAVAGDQDQRHAWGRIASTASEYLEHYHGDLLWDWALLRKYWDTRGFTFFYGVRETGTWMADSERLFRDLERGCTSGHRWKVTVTFYDSGEFRDMSWEDWAP